MRSNVTEYELKTPADLSEALALLQDGKSPEEVASAGRGPRRRSSDQVVEHAIREKTHGHLLRQSVQTESLAPDAQRAGGELPAVASPPKQGFFRRLFGGGDESQKPSE